MIFENESIRNRFTVAFPKFYINHNLEAIVHPRRNSYFLLTDVHTEKDLIAKSLSGFPAKHPSLLRKNLKNTIVRADRSVIGKLSSNRRSYTARNPDLRG